MPSGEGWVPHAPVEVGEAEIEVGQAAADGDVADAEARRREVERIAFEAVERSAGLEGEAVEQRRQPRLLGLLALVAPEDEDIQQPVAESVAGERRPPLRPGRREQDAATGE